MTSHTHLFIGGALVPARGESDLPVTDSFTQAPFASYRSASAADVDAAVAAARGAFDAWAATPVAERIAAVRRVAAALREQAEALTVAISREVGMPRKLAARIQVGAPIAAWDMYADLAAAFEWETRIGHSLVQQVPTGVVACITPWNYPLHQITGKVAPALLAGCTVVLKPSELAPTSAFLLAEAVRQAGLPPGVFNLLHGTGAEVGEALVRHPGVDMVSFTGSTRAGRHIASVAGSDIKRVALELGGKSAALVLPGADLALAVKATLAGCMLNSGQTCSATTRLLVPRDSLAAVEDIARELLAGYRMGDPADGATRLGPLVSKAQQQKVRGLIDEALAAGARRIAAEAAVPAHGFFVPPTVLTGVEPGMAVARKKSSARCWCSWPMTASRPASNWPTAPTTAWLQPCGALSARRRWPSRAACAPDRSTSTARRSTPRRLSAASRNPASGGRTAASASRSSSNRCRSRCPRRSSNLPCPPNPPNPRLHRNEPDRIASPMTFTQILYRVDGPVATVTFNRPEQMNALTKVLEAELRSAIEQAGRDPAVRAIVLTGAGRAFCAGMDMAELAVLPPEDIQAEEWMRPYDMNRRADYQTRYTYFPAAPKPIISAINGAAAGLGLVMALYSDFRIASEKAVFATAFAKRGLIAEHGIAWMLPRIVGHANATDLLLTSRKIDAAEALSMGLVHRVVAADELCSRRRRWPRRCRPRSRRARCA
jgi:acyl-CoA reductase-like NAD-dependent aldehyde dehydrogenase/enoyl-CoA hydratase/carnithine racemase